MNLFYIEVALDVGQRITSSIILSSIEEYMINMFESKRKLAGESSLEETAVLIVGKLSSALGVESKNRLLQSIISFQLSARSNSSSKSGFFMIKTLDCNLQQTALILNWLKTLPRTLWKLKLQSLDYSKAIILLLRNRVIADPTFGDCIGLSLLPLFATQSDKSYIYGPFIGYPMELQESLLSLLYYLSSWPANLIPSVIHCLQSIAL